MGRSRLPIDAFMSEITVRVLIVDDDDDMTATLMDFISRLGGKVNTVGDVADAQWALRTEVTPFNLVLTNLMLPGGSGMNVLKAGRMPAARRPWSPSLLPVTLRWRRR
jgi:DNA-binding response OmpR family regulator